MKKRVMMRMKDMIGVSGCLLSVRLELEMHKKQPYLMKSIRCSGLGFLRGLNGEDELNGKDE